MVAARLAAVFLADRFVSGRFQNNGESQLLGISGAESAESLNFDGSSWATSWSSKFGLGGGWNSDSDKTYLAGHFDASLPPGQDRLLALNGNNGAAALMTYNNGTSPWTTLWSTGGGKIATWYMHKEDQYIAGDFAGLGYDQGSRH